MLRGFRRSTPSIRDNCRVLQGKKCGVCAKVCQAKAVDYEQKDTEVEINVASVIISTGYELFDATQISEYGYGKLPNVISSLEMERLLSAGGPTKGHLSRPSVVHGEVRLGELDKLITRAEKKEETEKVAELRGRAEMAGESSPYLSYRQEARLSFSAWDQETSDSTSTVPVIAVCTR